MDLAPRTISRSSNARARRIAIGARSCDRSPGDAPSQRSRGDAVPCARRQCADNSSFGFAGDALVACRHPSGGPGEPSRNRGAGRRQSLGRFFKRTIARDGRPSRSLR